ncbi:alpha/beta hydrolase [Paenibacillus roseipurpureus]|uniref:Alpha/beta hydrolase n=1 Tax=Paenibacillus roseopurpureus TaxID=2918901 RepID=A0AA96RN40_9BACL|nr:lysophospholipase [Paenibacillus sp. MBLB1832]WNR44992.1 alpha/beta hydrolase [Paenibacillus sp. MBLB1832]
MENSKIIEGTLRGVGGATLFYRRTARPEAPVKGVIILVHGHGDHSGGLANMCDALVRSGYIVYAADSRGHGRSPGIRGFIRSWDEYTGDLHAMRELAKSEFPQLPLFIVGHSLGGVISTDYVLTRETGLSGLVLVAPAISYKMTTFEKWLIRILGKVRPQLTIQKKGGSIEGLTQDPDMMAKLQSDPLRHSTITPGLGVGLSQAVPRIMQQAASLKLPLLLQYGLEDQMTPPEKLEQFLLAVGSLDKTSHAYATMRHRPFDDVGREQFLADLIHWLDQHV